jgi:hypothetical protein
MNPPVSACGGRSAQARPQQIWIAISLTKRADRSIFAASKLLIEPKPHMKTVYQRNPDDMHACMTRRCFSAATGACCCC